MTVGKERKFATARLYNGMTEEEILAAGKTFSVNSPAAAQRHIAVKAKLDAINNGVWETPEQRNEYLREVFGAPIRIIRSIEDDTEEA